jgi:hypothetical protein
MYSAQQGFNLADVSANDALLDGAALRRFVCIDLRRERPLDGTTPLKFRCLLESNERVHCCLSKSREALRGDGLKMGTGAIVDRD